MIQGMLYGASRIFVRMPAGGFEILGKMKIAEQG